MPWDLAVPLAAAGSGAAWARLAAVRAADGARAGSTALPLLAGVAAAGMALAAYDLLARAGLAVAWETVVAGGGVGVAAALAIGLVEEGAKLAGLLLVAERPSSRRAALASAVGVAAGFAAVETALTLRGAPPAAALARAAFGPVAHALLALPLAAGVAAAGHRPPVRALLLGAALAGAAALHAVGDLALARAGGGRLAYAAALAAPAVALFAAARARRRK